MFYYLVNINGHVGALAVEINIYKQEFILRKTTSSDIPAVTRIV